MSNLSITASINEDKLAKQQLKVSHQVTFFEDLKTSKMRGVNYDVLVIASHHIAPEETSNLSPLVSSVLLSSAIIVTDDQKTPEEIYLALKRLDLS